MHSPSVLKTHYVNTQKLSLKMVQQNLWMNEPKAKKKKKNLKWHGMVSASPLPCPIQTSDQMYVYKSLFQNEGLIFILYGGHDNYKIIFLATSVESWISSMSQQPTKHSPRQACHNSSLSRSNLNVSQLHKNGICISVAPQDQKNKLQENGKRRNGIYKSERTRPNTV